MPDHLRSSLNITGTQIFTGAGFALASPTYGAGMVLDCLEEMYLGGMLSAGDNIIMVGSMGSLSSEISLNQVVLPDPALCAYYGFDGLELHQDKLLIELLKTELKAKRYDALAYRHGSSFAVFDPHTDHLTYKSSLYDNRVLGVDCGEVFVGLEFAQRKGTHAAAALYCSDCPTTHIADIGESEFRQRATENDLLLNTVAAGVLSKSAG